jgi:hypothetical protein
MARIPVVVCVAALLNREKRDVALVASDRAVVPRAIGLAVPPDGAGKLRTRWTEKALLRRCP